MTGRLSGRRNEAWVDGDYVKASDAFGDEIWAAPQESGSISFKSVSSPGHDPWVTLNLATTQEFMRLIAEQVSRTL